jgi:uncharacterized protein YkwD
MGRGRTSILAVAVAIAAVAVAPPASQAADLGDLLGILGGGSGGSGGSSPPQTSPPPSRPPEPGAAQPQGEPVPARSKLLAPDSKCPGQTDSKLGPGARAQSMACMLSYARVAKGRPALRIFKPLRTSATDKARDVRRCHKLSHEACGRDPFYWIGRVGFFKGDWIAGEILAWGPGQAGTVLATVRAWLGSPTHRAVILHPKFNLVGVGSVRGRFHGARHVTIWAAHLGYHHIP